MSALTFKTILFPVRSPSSLFTIASATEPLLISQSLFSEGGRRDSKVEIIFKNSPKSPDKDCSTL